MIQSFRFLFKIRKFHKKQKFSIFNASLRIADVSRVCVAAQAHPTRHIVNLSQQTTEKEAHLTLSPANKPPFSH
jgi:hypothetical protein